MIEFKIVEENGMHIVEYADGLRRPASDIELQLYNDHIRLLIASGRLRACLQYRRAGKSNPDYEDQCLTAYRKLSPAGLVLAPKEPDKEMVDQACRDHGFPAGDRHVYARGYASMLESWTRRYGADPASADPATAWAEGYRSGVTDERTSESNIGIAGFGAKIEPARANPYMIDASPKGGSTSAPRFELTNGQIAQLADFAGTPVAGAPLDEQDVLVIQHTEAGPSGPGLYAHYDELPEEGAIYLDGQLPDSPKGGNDALQWAVSRWNAEVCNRPLVNVHRRSLDDAWRQVIRHLGGDDVTLCGPRHDDLLAATQATSAEVGS